MSAAEQAAARWFSGAQLSPLGAGHIHDTYLLTPATGERYVLQRVNEYVFKDGDLVMLQTRRLLDHWRQQQRYRVAELVPSASGAAAERVGDALWRVWRYLEGTRVVDPVSSLRQAEAAGAAFGFFQAHMASLPGPRFEDTIKGFLQLEHYLAEFAGVAAAAPDALRRLVETHAPLAAQFRQRNTYIHGDCKVNNLLFAEEDTVVAVIDFDTAMYGHWAWDFGDLLRSLCFSLGRVDIPYFEHCLQGFAGQQPLVNGAGGAADCAAAPAYVALMLGLRFLTDHLQGDVYFRVREHGENLRRAEQQFRLLGAFVDQQAALRAAAAGVLKVR